MELLVRQENDVLSYKKLHDALQSIISLLAYIFSIKQRQADLAIEITYFMGLLGSGLGSDYQLVYLHQRHPSEFSCKSSGFIFTPRDNLAHLLLSELSFQEKRHSPVHLLLLPFPASSHLHFLLLKSKYLNLSDYSYPNCSKLIFCIS